MKMQRNPGTESFNLSALENEQMDVSLAPMEFQYLTI